MAERFEMLDLWMALGLDSADFDPWMDEPRRTPADAWAQLVEMGVDAVTITLTVHTNQEAYDVVKAHLSTMPKRARNADGSCVYCTREGRRCAVGVLLDCSDDEARELSSVGVRSARSLIDFGDVAVGLLVDLQAVHDGYDNWSRSDGFVGHDQLRRVARKWGLTP